MISRTLFFGKLPKPMLKAFLRRIRDGDPRCSIPVGVRVEKINSEPGDKHKDGDQGLVMGSVYYENQEIYFVIFDDQLAGKTWTPDFILTAEREDDDEDFFPITIKKAQIRRLF